MPNKVTFSFILDNRFTNQAKKIARSTEGIRRKFRKLGPAARAASRGVARSFSFMKKGALALQTSMAPLLAAFAGIAGVIKGITVGTNFQDAMLDFSAITLTTGKNLEFVRKESLRLGKEAKVGSAFVAEAFKLVASAQSELLEDPEALSTVVENVLLLKNAAGSALELSGAASVLTKSLNAFNAPAEDAARFVNVLAAGAGIGASELGEISLAMKEAGPAAVLTKTSFEELNAGLQVLAKKGAVVGAQAGTKLRDILLSLSIKLPRKIQPAVIGFSGSLAALAPIMNDATELARIFGREQSVQARILIENVALIRQWTDEFTGTNVAQRQAEIQLSKLSSKFRGLAVILANKVIAVFEKLTPQFEQIADDIGRFLDTITKEDLAAFVDGLTTALSVMRAMASTALSIGKFFGAGESQVIRNVSGSDIVNRLREQGAFGGGLSPVQRSRTDIAVTVGASPGATVDGVKTKTTGSVAGVNTGVNMAEAG